MDALALQILAIDAQGTEHWEWAVLDSDTSVKIEMQSPLFGNGSTFSYPFTIPVEPNRHIIGNADQMHGARLHDILHMRPARLWLCGIPFRRGIIRLDEEVEVTPGGEIEIELTSERGEWDEMIDGMKARDVSVRDDICIGMALWREREGYYNVKLKDVRVQLSSYVLRVPKPENEYGYSDGYYEYPISGGLKQDINVGSVVLPSNSGIQRWPKYVLPKGTFRPYPPFAQGATVNACNVSEPFTPAEPELHPYCNVRICYQKHKLQKQSDSWEETTERGYDVSDAERPNSAPNFYVLYWLYRLFKDKKIAVMENALEDIEDARRLFFVNTSCAYREPDDLKHNPGQYGMYEFPLPTGTLTEGQNPDALSRGKGVSSVSQKDSYGLNLSLVGSGTTDNVTVTGLNGRDAADKTEGHCAIESTWNPSGLAFLSTVIGHKAFATSENYPDADVKDVLETIEAMFGVRFLFDDAFTQVRIVLLRDVLRNAPTEELKAQVLSVEKKESNTKGFRLTYGGGEDDTTYHYDDYSRLRSDLPYSRLINNITALDKTCYYTPNNGNAYRIKVDNDAKNFSELNASLFEVGQFADAEDGDCTGDDETIETVTIKAKPAIMSDVNFENERAGIDTEQRFALFVDADMKTRWPYAIKDGEVSVEGADESLVQAADQTDVSVNGQKVKQWGLMALTGDGYFKKTNVEATLAFTYDDGTDYAGNVIVSIPVTFDLEGVINEGYNLYPFDNYDPTDEGGSPIEQVEWGLTLGVMRGGGGDAGIVYYDHNYDGEGNSRWAISAGSKYASHPDVCDSYGNPWDYNGRVEISSRSQAAVWITNNFPATAQTIMMVRYPVSIRDLYLQAWRTKMNFGGLSCQADRTLSGTASGDQNSELTLFRGTFQGHTIVFTPVVWYATRIPIEHPIISTVDFITYLQRIWDDNPATVIANDQAAGHYILAIDPTDADYSNLLRVRNRYFGLSDGTIYIDNGLGGLDGRFSLKPRMEKPGLDITDPLNARRGLADVFYPEYSHFVRNRRIAELELDVELAELLWIDFTKRYHILDLTGFLYNVCIDVNMEGIEKVTSKMYYI